MKYIESKTLELNEKYTDNILKTISAFSNNDGGIVLIGVKDNGVIVGISNPFGFKIKIENTINNSINPIPIYELELIKEEGKDIFKIIVTKGENSPYYYKNVAYTRNDTSTIPIDRYNLTQLILKSKNLTYDELVSSKKQLSFNYLEGVFKKNVGIEKLEENNLISIGLINGGKYNIAAELLSDTGGDTNAYVDIAKFKLNNNIFENRIFTKNKSILEQYDIAIEVFNNYYKPQEVVGDKVRAKIEPVPFIAFKEALNNAIIHRDYLLEGGIQIAMFDNRIEIRSPGGLPVGISPEVYLMGLTSKPRNQIISFIFFRLGVIEQFGTGVGRIIKSYRNSGWKPYFGFIENQIKVVLPVINFDYGVLNDKEAILAFLGAQPLSQRSEIEQVVKVEKTRLVRRLNELVAAGEVSKKGVGAHTKYELAHS